ncbi:hypothetical protein SDC9_165102 [bioreactor metagenome]|uniref:Uncharacterized protein n=1 Tax=bioreactor metagenome TaxID=1076179 RepID=A0A645FTF1_9ZZZZ
MHWSPPKPVQPAGVAVNFPCACGGDDRIERVDALLSFSPKGSGRRGVCRRASVCVRKSCGRASRSEEKRTFSRHFPVRAAVISRGIRALRGKVLDLTIAGNWPYEMEPVLPTMSHRNFRHFSIERGRFCDGRPP